MAPECHLDQYKVRVIMNAVDTSNHQIKGNKSNGKLDSTLTVDSALLMVPCFLCSAEPPTAMHYLPAGQKLA